MNPLLKCLPCVMLMASSLQAQFVNLATMPEPVSNNAVVAADVGGKTYVYSFCGIDSTKIWSGIHLNAWRYDVAENEWMQLPDVPDSDGGKIAAAASNVNGKIYLIGGYHVAQSGSETSSNKVHVFDPETNTWLPGAAPVPVPIDDHVQAVWRDSLVYVVTGWSNTTNVPNVQVFNPSENTWGVGVPVPDQSAYKVFGGSGVIIGDTIFYAGGARANVNFSPSSVFRKGIINPNNPTEITWSMEPAPEAKGYRMAAAVHQGRAVWLGGSDVTYNFNGIAYNGSGGVPPLDRITVFDPQTNSFFQTFGEMPSVMDLRSAAQINENEVVIAGGMLYGQQVTNGAWRIQLDNLTGIEEGRDEVGFYKIYPNPAFNELTVELPGGFSLEVYNADGSLVFYQDSENILTFPVFDFPAGVYWVDIATKKGLRATEKVIVNH